MNEQFSKLLQECIVPANQAVEYSKSKGFVIPDEKLDVAKFAELIVRECVGIVAKRKDQAIDDGWNVDEAMSMAEMDLEEHFGVKE